MKRFWLVSGVLGLVFLITLAFQQNDKGFAQEPPAVKDDGKNGNGPRNLEAWRLQSVVATTYELG